MGQFSQETTNGDSSLQYRPAFNISEYGKGSSGIRIRDEQVITSTQLNSSNIDQDHTPVDFSFNKGNLMKKGG